MPHDIRFQIDIFELIYREKIVPFLLNFLEGTNFQIYRYGFSHFIFQNCF